MKIYIQHDTNNKKKFSQDRWDVALKIHLIRHQIFLHVRNVGSAERFRDKRLMMFRQKFRRFHVQRFGRRRTEVSRWRCGDRHREDRRSRRKRHYPTDAIVWGNGLTNGELESFNQILTDLWKVWFTNENISSLKKIFLSVYEVIYLSHDSIMIVSG